MEATATRVEPGQFYWYELLTNDADAAIEFYRHVIGWTTQPYEFPGNEGPAYTVWQNGGAGIGGVMEIDPDTMGEMSPQWVAYVYVTDVDDTVRRAKELGGQVIQDPMDLPTVGRMAGLADPQGATFWLLAPSSDESMPKTPAVGSFSWNELATSDSQASLDFYRQLFDWDTIEELDMGNGWMYRMFGRKGSMWGGIYNSSPDSKLDRLWLFYVRVEDIDAAVERVKERGGTVVSGPMEVPGGDRVAECRDPQGAAFGLHASQ